MKWIRSIPFWCTVLTLCYFYIPIVMLIIDSFNMAKFGGVWQGFTWQWYQQLFHDKKAWQALSHSLLIAFSSTIASTLLGAFAAFTIHRYKTHLQLFHRSLIYAPLLLPDLLVGISLLVFFVFMHIKLGLFTIFLAHTSFSVSYVTLLLLARFQQFDFSVLEAAYDLGASQSQVLSRIFVPMMTPALVAASLLSFTLSFDDFVVTFFVTGPGSTTLPIYIYSMIRYGATPMIHAMSTLILFFSLTTVIITTFFTPQEASS